MGTTTATTPTTDTATPFDTALDSVLGEETAATETAEETTAEDEAELALDETDETAVKDTGDEGEKAADAESAAAEVEEEELDLGEETEKKEESDETEEDDLEEELSQDDEIKPDSEDEKNLYFKKSKAHRLMEAHADMKKIREEIPGANVEALKEHYENSITHNRMLEDFDGGFDGMNRVLGYLLGNPEHPESVKAVNEESTKVFAASLPIHLARTHPQALVTMENVMYDALVRDLYRQAGELEKTSSDKNAVEQAYALAENLELKLFKKLTKRGQQSDAHAGGPSEREKQLERELEQHRREKETGQQQIIRQRQEAINASVQEADREEIDSWIGKVKAKGAKFTETEERHIRRDLLEAIEAAVKSNTAWRRQFDTQRDAAVRKFSEESRDNLKAQRRQFVSTFVRRNLRAVVAENTRSAVAASKTAHEKQKATQTRRQAPPSGERTSRKIDVGKAFREKKMTYDSLLDKIV